jgi:hypothetical protein
MQLMDPETGSIVNMLEPRIKAGVLITPPGNGGDDLVKAIAERIPEFKSPSFAEMKTPALVVVGDADVSPQPSQIAI